jgi:hypothetical protein
MAVYAEFRVYWHSDTKPRKTNVVERAQIKINANIFFLNSIFQYSNNNKEF